MWPIELIAEHYTESCERGSGETSTSTKPPGTIVSTPAITEGRRRLMSGQLALVSTTLAIRREARFCWYSRLRSVVTKISKPGGLGCGQQVAVSERIPPCARASSTTCWRSAAAKPRGTPLSSRTRISERAPVRQGFGLRTPERLSPVHE